jgi:hypothetical protein
MTARFLRILVDDPDRLAVPGVLDTYDALLELDRDHTVYNEMIRIETLEADLLRILERAGYDLTDEQRADLKECCRSKTNTSPHLRDRDYFDDECLELVATRERFLIERYHYTPPD